MRPCRAIIVEDEEPARAELRYLISSHGGCEVVGEAGDAAEALVLLKKVRPDVVFLDVQMPGMTGEKLAEVIAGEEQGPLIVFATAYDRYAVDAFAVEAVDYLLKPFDPERVAVALRRVKERLEIRGQVAATAATATSAATAARTTTAPARVDAAAQEAAPPLAKLPVWNHGRLLLVDYGAIIFAVARDGEVEVVVARTTGADETAAGRSGSGRLVFAGTLQQLEQRLASGNTRGIGHFLRVHKSYLVNLDRVAEVVPWFKGTYWLRMADPDRTEIPVSRQVIVPLKDAFGL